MKKFITNGKNQTLIVMYIGLFLIAFGASWVFFSHVSTGTAMTGDGLSAARAGITESTPRTEECPLNGMMYTKAERDIWEGRRPMGINIENHIDSRPQSGLSRADVVYEAVAEGGITRYLAMFYCGAAAENVTVGPIRSSRVYFIDWVAEYGDKPLYVHFGGANNICTNKEDPDCRPDGTKRPGKIDPRVMAIEQLINMGWRHAKGNALDGGANAGAPAIIRNQYRLSDTASAWEHSAIGFTDLLYDLAIERGFGQGWNKNFEPWSFADDQPVASPSSRPIAFSFWGNSSAYDVEWRYNRETNSYLRYNGGTAHVDWEFGKPQLTAKNVVVMFIREEGPVDEEKHLYYETIGSGNALIFQNGGAIAATWNKPSRFARTKFYDERGQEISFTRGTVWIAGVPAGNTVRY